MNNYFITVNFLLTKLELGVMLYAKIPASWYTKEAVLGTYVDTQMYIIFDPSTVDAGGITGALQGASTGLAIE